MKIAVLAVGKAQAEDAALAAEYLKRMKDTVSVKEFASVEKLSAAIPSKAFVVLLDEHGKDMPSRDLAAKLEAWLARGQEIVFIIGGADGAGDDLRSRADFTLAFGRLTWPHRLARVMLLEQIYRARQISAGHPYHRD